MHLAIVAVVLAATTLSPVALMAEQFSSVQVGANYYMKGMLSDTAVKVVSVDRARGKVQVVNHENGFIEWVSASELATPNQATERTVGRVGLAAIIAAAAYQAATADNNKSTAKSRPAAPRNTYRPVAKTKPAQKYQLGFTGQSAIYGKDVAAGVLIKNVAPRSAASRAGLKPGDHIIRVDGKYVPDMPTMVARVRASRGRRMTLQGFRGSKSIEINAAPKLR